MKIEQLLNFKLVAEQRSYTRAAEKAFLTQSAIYSQVRQLELEVGEKLFYVAGKEVLLTIAGRELFAFASRVATAHADLQANSSARHNSRRHHVRLAALSYFGVLSEAAERLRAEDPGCVVEFSSHHPGNAIQLIRSGAKDFAFFGPAFLEDGLSFEQCDDNDIVIVAPPDHELVGRELLFSDVAKSAIVGYASGSARTAIDRWLESHPDQPVRYAAQTDSSMAVKTMALAMGMPAFVVRGAVSDDLAAGNLAELTVIDFSASYPLLTVFLGEDELGEGARRYRQHLQDIWHGRNSASV